jgi:hypothetical protein
MLYRVPDCVRLLGGRIAMSRRLRDAVSRLQEVKDRVSDLAAADAIQGVIAEALKEILLRDSVAKDLAPRISALQEEKLVKLYGPTGFSRAHLEPELICRKSWCRTYCDDRTRPRTAYTRRRLRAGTDQGKAKASGGRFGGNSRACTTLRLGL